MESFYDLSRQKEAEQKLKLNIKELEEFNRFTINREERMIELKHEINQLYTRMNKGIKYKIVM